MIQKTVNTYKRVESSWQGKAPAGQSTHHVEMVSRTTIWLCWFYPAIWWEKMIQVEDLGGGE